MAHATDQARVAAATLLGHETAYTSVPWFWSDQGDLRLQIAGLPHGADQLVVRGELGSESFSLLSYRAGPPHRHRGHRREWRLRRREARPRAGDDDLAQVAADPTVPLRRGLQTVVTSTSGTVHDRSRDRPMS